MEGTDLKGLTRNMAKQTQDNCNRGSMAVQKEPVHFGARLQPGEDKGHQRKKGKQGIFR
jgi:hypothetical protein